MDVRVVALGVLLLFGAGCAQPGPSASNAEALDDLLGYVASLRGDGDFQSGMAPYVVEVAWAAGRDPATWPPEHPVLPDVQVPAGGPLLQVLRPLYALALADAPGADERRARILESFDGEQFGDPLLLNDDAFALLALDADGEPDTSEAVRSSAGFLLAHRDGGGWSYAIGGPAGVDTTGIALAALASAGRLADVPAADVAGFLAAARDGAGYAESTSGTANCDSTVWALRSLSLLGLDTPSAAWDFLISLQQVDGGIAYRPGQGSNGLCSVEVATLWGLRATDRLVAV